MSHPKHPKGCGKKGCHYFWDERGKILGCWGLQANPEYNDSVFCGYKTSAPIGFWVCKDCAVKHGYVW